jgi:hypothetical protein
MSTILNPKQGCYTIHHDIINFSTSQQKFSFGKQRRFPSVKPTTPTDFTVTLNSTFGRRSPSFGVGERFKNLANREQCKLHPSLNPQINSYIKKTLYKLP